MTESPHSMVDILAEKLSALTGTKFTIVRMKVYFGSSKSILYTLRAEREDTSWTFQSRPPVKIDELKHRLAFVCDMVEMGFIPVKES